MITGVTTSNPATPRLLVVRGFIDSYREISMRVRSEVLVRDLQEICVRQNSVFYAGCATRCHEVIANLCTGRFERPLGLSINDCEFPCRHLAKLNPALFEWAANLTCIQLKISKGFIRVGIVGV